MELLYLDRCLSLSLERDLADFLRSKDLDLDLVLLLSLSFSLDFRRSEGLALA